MPAKAVQYFLAICVQAEDITNAIKDRYDIKHEPEVDEMQLSGRMDVAFSLGGHVIPPEDVINMYIDSCRQPSIPCSSRSGIRMKDAQTCTWYKNPGQKAMRSSTRCPLPKRNRAKDKTDAAEPSMKLDSVLFWVNPRPISIRVWTHQGSSDEHQCGPIRWTLCISAFDDDIQIV